MLFVLLFNALFSSNVNICVFADNFCGHVTARTYILSIRNLFSVIN